MHQHTHTLCVERNTQLLEGKGALSVSSACPPSWLPRLSTEHLARHWQGNWGISRTRLDTSNFTLDKSTPFLGRVGLHDWDDSNSSMAEQPCTAGFVGALREHLGHIVAAQDLPQCDSAIFHQSLEPQVLYLQMAHTSEPSGRADRLGR